MCLCCAMMHCAALCCAVRCLLFCCGMVWCMACCTVRVLCYAVLLQYAPKVAAHEALGEEVGQHRLEIGYFGGASGNSQAAGRRYTEHRLRTAECHA
mmetsp:Transcript_56728/g.112649  ORF Transcript_56728/g.112649 Transcript_56728/m.112649 type:complete len:97 (-) Transcript_56728:221-511(-)